MTYKVSDFLAFFSTNSLSWECLEYGDGLLNVHYGLIHQELPILIDLKESKLPSIKNEYIPNKYTLCQEGDLIFTDASEDINDIGKVVELINCNGKSIICGLHSIHARDKLKITITGFKGYAFSSQQFRKQIQQLAQGSKVYSISTKNFNECYMNIPSKEEQSKITDFLSLIDEKIANEKKVLKILQQQKVSFLKELFI
ncbi:restriction endonuclease subunit S [Emticicia sp. BO119]|nr:restriction endonuclease subunit S [Emticicia sp. BO119]